MANTSLSESNPMYVDTAAVVTTETVTIQTITWGTVAAGSAVAAGNGFVLTNTAGDIIFTRDAQTGALETTISFPKGLKAVGVICTVLDGGVALIYCA